MNKCIVNGTVTFQSDPCPSGLPRTQPTIQELNAQEKKRRETAKPATAPVNRTAAAAPANGAGLVADPAVPAPAMAPSPSFRCDGRQHCTQMTSCAEAKYFLANCPGVKMDGDHDGIPCEQQWCHP